MWRGFTATLGPERTVCNNFLASEQCWPETCAVRSDELELLNFVRLAPVIFVEVHTDQPITYAVADLLTELDQW
jgi:hypothetical protein